MYPSACERTKAARATGFFNLLLTFGQKCFANILNLQIMKVLPFRKFLTLTFDYFEFVGLLFVSDDIYS
jgi:hypothetical protein